ncbi:hypothetical protein PG984_013427 [Apiospora sp. TS-2023a]
MHFQSLLQLAIAMASGLSMVMPAMAAPTSDNGLQSDNDLTSYWGCKVDNGGCYYVDTTMVCNCQTNG